MRLLAMDTSTWALAVGVIEDGRVLGELNTNMTQNHSLRLMPAIEWLLGQIELTPQDLEGIAVGHGPGSYTGTRIGVTTAKAMAWSLQIPIIGVSSLQVVAQNRAGFEGNLIPMFDARRNQVYTGMYTHDQERQMVTPVVEDRIQLITEWLEELKEVPTPLLFMGAGVHVHHETIKDFLGSQAQFAPRPEHVPHGSQLAYLAWQMWGRRVEDAHHFTPQYLQLAEAEKKWLQKK